MEETKEEKPELIALTDDERLTVESSVKKVLALNAEVKYIMETIYPFIKLIAKNHDIDVDEYALLPDCSAFTKK